MLEIYTYTDKYNSILRQLLRTLYVKRKDENLILSPISVLMLLALAADASSGDTRTEIMQVLDNAENEEDILHLLYRIQDLLCNNNDFSTANAVCIRHSLMDAINPLYSDHLKTLFGGELFFSDNLVSDVNAWVKKHTNGLINSIMDDSMSNIVACLLNAAVFEGKWVEHYTRNDIKYKDFTNADGSVKETAMITAKERKYIEDDVFTGFVKPYKDCDFSFMALLPKENSTDSLEKSLENIHLSNIFRNSHGIDVRALLPEFSYTFEEDLTFFCKEMGIQKLFTDDADFSPLCSMPLALDSIIHKAKITVDRHGTKAAAVSAGLLRLGSAGGGHFYKVVNLDRPFVYAIMHNVTCLPVFTGIVSKMGNTI